MNSKTHIHFLKISNQFSVQDFEQIKNFILKEGNQKTYRNFDNNNPYYYFKKFATYLASDIGQQNINNDPKVSDFNTLTLKDDNQYYEIIVVRTGDIKAKKKGIASGMLENEVYLTDYGRNDLDKIPNQLIIYFNDMLKVKK
ncbi:hypothetical protein SD960_12975 [Flavobacterium sp. MMLR14_040]|uniref:hypothetical protein n=1 Tax=Flavobacterium sp. MMLR14_040 TaxID=3093843 RepID=UPI00298F8892|nr:hypothetical protein [Flavobacterium sp. MMLR14_040]MDW8851011.1 hypothetical protein [Flavobacterium sp. MMLR14_040]